MRFLVLLFFLVASFLFIYRWLPGESIVPEPIQKKPKAEKAQVEHAAFTEWDGGKKLFSIKARRLSYSGGKVSGENVQGELYADQKLIFSAAYAVYEKKSQTLKLQKAELASHAFLLKAKAMKFFAREKTLSGDRILFTQQKAKLIADRFSTKLPLKKLLFEGHTKLFLPSQEVS